MDVYPRSSDQEFVLAKLKYTVCLVHYISSSVLDKMFSSQNKDNYKDDNKNSNNNSNNDNDDKNNTNNSSSNNHNFHPPPLKLGGNFLLLQFGQRGGS